VDPAHLHRDQLKELAELIKKVLEIKFFSTWQWSLRLRFVAAFLILYPLLKLRLLLKALFWSKPDWLKSGRLC
jgi:hypothetical protein